MSKSIISNNKRCIVCGTTKNLHRHHIYYGTGNRRQSEKFGCWCYLCGNHHNLSNEGVHFNSDLDEAIKRVCQIRFEAYHSRDEFREIFGRSYL